MKKRRIVFAVLTVLWMGMIFLFSHKEGESSGEISRSAGNLLCEIFVPDYEDLNSEEKEQMVESINYPLRKMAHMLEYLLLGLLLSGAMIGEIKGVTPVKLIPVFGTAVLYAASDEYHQLFVPGRTGKFTDVLIDSAGVLIGLVIFYLIFHRKKVIK
ncbi:MAG: VanZ family protein [Lachnospiraceae bacterium]